MDQDFEIHLEPVTEWLYLHAVLTAIMSAWSSRGEKIGGRGILQRELKANLSLDFQIDPQERKATADLLANSLADALKAQLGMSLNAGVYFKQCDACRGWFAIKPGVGRPDKLYCSAACKMRQYRRSKRG